MYSHSTLRAFIVSASLPVKTTSALSKTTGNHRRSAPLDSVGKSGGTVQKSPNSPTSNRWEALISTRSVPSLPTGWNALHSTCKMLTTFLSIRWNEHLNYGDVHRQSEIEYSKYNFEHANVEMLFELFSTYEKETYACLDAGLVLPATDHVLKCSHTFNMLDARGVISVTERVSYIERVRRLAQRIARAYVESA